MTQLTKEDLEEIQRLKNKLEIAELDYAVLKIQIPSLKRDIAFVKSSRIRAIGIEKAEKRLAISQAKLAEHNALIA